jgi:ABC-type amino acid transport substrate-binding protein
MATQEGHADIARLLVEHGAVETAMDEQVASPWEVALAALQQGEVELAPMLVRDADATAVDQQVAIPWEGALAALQQGEVELAPVLEHDADATT